MAVSVNPRVPRGETAQGFYIAGADGTGYGWTQSGNAKTTLEFLGTGLQKFREKPPKTVTIADSDEERKLAPNADTTVIRVYSWAPTVPAQTESVGLRAIGRDQRCSRRRLRAAAER